MKKNLLYLFFILPLLSCGQASFQKVKLKNTQAVQIERVDQAVLKFSFEENRLKWGYPFEWYALQMTPLEDIPGIRENWHLLQQDSIFNLIQKQIDAVYPDLHKEEKQFSEAFAYLKHHFPELQQPKIYTVNSGLNYGNQLEDSLIFIGLDLYLGKDNPVTLHSSYPLYLQMVMDRTYILPDAMSHFIFERFYQEPENMNFIEMITVFGKMMYLLDCALPFTPDYLKMKYTQAQFAWTLEAEADIWMHIVKNDLLYSQDMRRINGWLNVAPFVSEFSPESPDRLGIYIGWKMVRAYMQAHPDLSAENLLQKNYKEILSFYKP